MKTFFFHSKSFCIHMRYLLFFLMSPDLAMWGFDGTSIHSGSSLPVAKVPQYPNKFDGVCLQCGEISRKAQKFYEFSYLNRSNGLAWLHFSINGSAKSARNRGQNFHLFIKMLNVHPFFFQKYKSILAGTRITVHHSRTCPIITALSCDSSTLRQHAYYSTFALLISTSYTLSRLLYSSTTVILSNSSFKIEHQFNCLEIDVIYHRNPYYLIRLR